MIPVLRPLFFCRTPALAAGLVVLLSVFAADPAAAQRLPPGQGGRCTIDDLAFAVTDPGVPGVYNPIKIDYFFGGFDGADLDSTDDPTEMQAVVHFPEELECGPFPIVFLLHGIHESCVDGNGVQSFGWPCPAGKDPLPNHEGYDYLGALLASHGIVAVSISANGLYNTASDARAELIQDHMDLWADWTKNGGGFFSSMFYRRVAMNRVGTLGHSRGGEGVTRQYDLNASLGSPHGIRAIMLVGGVEGNADDQLVNDAALGVVLPYCDGDQQDMPSVAFFDRSRYATPGDSGAKHTFLTLGANHNYYNTYWIEDDWPEHAGAVDGPYCQEFAGGSGRLTPQQQRASLAATASGFFQAYLQNKRYPLASLRGDALPPPSAQTTDIYPAYLPPDEPESRLDINRYDVAEDFFSNQLGGQVSSAFFAHAILCDPATSVPFTCLSVADADTGDGSVPHAVWGDGVRQLRLGWDTLPIGSLAMAAPFDPVHENLLPGGQDVSRYRALQFRALVDFTDALNLPGGLPQDPDLRVELVDGAGLKASALVSDYSRALFFPPSATLYDSNGVDIIPRAILNTVRVPTRAFNDLYLQDIREIRMIFDQTDSGAITIADLAFADEAANFPPAVACSLAMTQLKSGGAKLVEVGLDVALSDDGNGQVGLQLGVFSDEDDSPAMPDAVDIGTGTLQLRGERDQNADGRVYIVAASAQDNDGLLAGGCCAAVVPLSNSPANVAAVNAQADAALQSCTAFAAAAQGLEDAPQGYFPVGE